MPVGRGVPWWPTVGVACGRGLGNRRIKPSSPVGDQATHTRRGATLSIVRHMSHNPGKDVTHANRGGNRFA